MVYKVILCIDDEQTVLTSLTAQLSSYFKDKYLIETAASGKEALEKADTLKTQNQDVPVLIVDYFMPDIKGEELLAGLHEKFPLAVKIVLKDPTSVELIARIVNKGKFYRYITKPWEEEDLILTVNEAIKSFYQTRRLTSLFNINQKVNTILELDKLLNYIIEKAIEVTGAYRGYLFLFDNSTRKLHVTVKGGVANDKGFAAIKDLVEEVSKQKESLLAGNIEQDLPVFYTRGLAALGIQSLLAVPIYYHDKKVGVCYLDNFSTENRFTEEDKNLLEMFMSAAATSIENAFLFEERRKAEQELLCNKEKLEEIVIKLRKILNGIIEIVSSILEKRDPYTAGHQRRVADLARTIATEMQLNEEKVDAIRLASNMHDLGKIGIPAEILSKPGKLDEIEFSLIKTHPTIGYEILTKIDFPWPIADIIFQHHERNDGSGYPQKLTSEQIMLEAKILAVADVVEAMASHRPYRPAVGISQALDEIRKNKGIKYESKVVDACLKIVKKGFKFSS
jgi:response regulator RpfG family c-di-GMP phosphodiesterase